MSIKSNSFGVIVSGEITLGFDEKINFGVFSDGGIGRLDDLIKNCGLIMYTTPEADGMASGYTMVVTDVAGTPTGANFISGSYIKINGVYPEVVTADTQEILYTAGVPNIIAYDDLANITGQQLFVSEDKQKIMFYNVILEEGSDCLFKAMSFLMMNEAFQVQTEEGSGIFENYNVNEGAYYVTKEWVVIS